MEQLYEGQLLIDTTGLDPAEVVAALYARATAGGPLFIEADLPRRQVTAEDARILLDGAADFNVRQPPPQDGRPVRYPDGSVHFDYLYGCALKVALYPDALDATGYDRDNGEGAAAETVAQLRTDTAR